PGAEHTLLVRDRVSRAQPRVLVVELLEVADGARVVARDVARDLDRSREQTLVLDDLVHQPELVRAPRVDEVPGQADLLRHPHPDRLGKEDAHPAAGRHTDTCVRVAELGPLRGDEEVARERELEPAGHAGAVDGADDGLRHLPQGREGVAGRVAGPALEVVTRAAELAQVETRAERGVGTGQDDDVDPVVALRVHERGRGSALQRGVERVARLGAVQRHDPDATDRLGEDQLLHGRDRGQRRYRRDVAAPPFTGVGVALVTLFDDTGALDTPATAELAARLVDLGVRAVVVAGGTGEAATLDRTERIELLDAVRAAVTGVPVIAGRAPPPRTRRPGSRVTRATTAPTLCSCCRRPATPTSARTTTPCDPSRAGAPCSPITSPVCRRPASPSARSRSCRSRG